MLQPTIRVPKWLFMVMRRGSDIIRYMRKGNIAIIIAVLVLVTLPVVYFFQSAKKPKTETTISQNDIESSTEAESTTSSSTGSSVPLPTGEDIIRTFINLINEKRIPDAIAMMDETMVPDDQTKQAWGVSFNSFSSAGVVSITEYSKEEWTVDRQRYKAVINISIKPGSNVIWEQGENTRWITLQKQADLWKIHEIATGP